MQSHKDISFKRKDLLGLVSLGVLHSHSEQRSCTIYSLHKTLYCEKASLIVWVWTSVIVLFFVFFFSPSNYLNVNNSNSRLQWKASLCYFICMCVYIYMYIYMYTYYSSSIQQLKVVRLSRKKKTCKRSNENFFICRRKKFYAERIFMKLMYESSLSWT